ncbi:hypothetical protein SNE40_016760 [Patella caerulea]|uniref:Uncharacterized protein n=1 Tax=Patella caerulea TaxID=87958 RepID=A0AAN8PP11_PATCE
MASLGSLQLLVAVLLCSLNVSLCDVCDNVYSEHAAKQQCFDDRGIDLALPLPGHQMSIVDDKPKDFTLMCNNSDVYAEAVACADNITRSCSSDESAKVLPSQKLQKESVAYICSHHQDLDMDCIRRHTWDITNCTQLEVAKNTDKIQHHGNDTLAVICLVHAITNSCANYNLRDCGFKTRVTYDKYNRFLNPEGCNEPHPLVG